MIRRPPRSTRTDTLFPYTTLVRSRDGNKRSLSAAPLSPFVSSEVETPIELAPPRWASRLRSMRTGWVSCCVYYRPLRSEEHTSELQSLMRISYAVFCLKKKKRTYTIQLTSHVTHKTTLYLKT